MTYKALGLLLAWAHRRRVAMRALRARGWTYQRIAKKYGISKQRVHNIVKGPE